MHMGIPVCKRARIAEKFADGDPITHNEIVRIWGLTYMPSLLLLPLMLCISGTTITTGNHQACKFAKT
jgi:hypothetical protein